MKPKLIRPKYLSNKITLKLISNLSNRDLKISPAGIRRLKENHSPVLKNNIITEEKREIGVLQEV